MVNGTCETAQVFPGELHIVSLEFMDEMANSSSQIFLTTAANISSTLRGFLWNTPGYIRTDVVALARGSVLATVNNVFQNSNATQESVNAAINDGIENSPPNGVFINTTFTATDLCARLPPACDSLSTDCTSHNGVVKCICKEGFILNNISLRNCSRNNTSEPAGNTSTPSPPMTSPTPGNSTLDPAGNTSTSGPTTTPATTNTTENSTDVTGPSTSPPENSNATTGPLPTSTSPGNTTLGSTTQGPAGNTSTPGPSTPPSGSTTQGPAGNTSTPGSSTPPSGSTTQGPAGNTSTPGSSTPPSGSTTQGPAGNTSTPGSSTPPSGSTTQGPAGNTSTPGSSTPPSGSTTQGPAGNTSTPGSSTPQTTTAKNNGTTAGLPTTTTTTTTTKSPVIVCPAVSCPPDSVCRDGICQCFAGSYMVDGTCETAQVFPGELHIVSLEFVDDMANSTSEIFRKTSAKISSELRGFLADTPGYVRSEVLSLARGSVLATVNNVFQNSNATQKSVNTAIVDGIKNSGGFLNGTIFTATELCLEQPLPCDSMSTKCQSLNGRAQCSCQEGFIPNVFSSKSCSACPSGTRADSVKRTCPP
uniref:SEA domain-containing protein n=1 Tax=Gadus morhua TaxID=8049 RepID=A0A8C4ZYS1_GADMO